MLNKTYFERENSFEPWIETFWGESCTWKDIFAVSTRMLDMWRAHKSTSVRQRLVSA